jgi:tetratricopeptide (TPR) repeat protein
LLEAATERKYDLNVRVVLFDWALAKKDVELRDRMLSEIRTLDTDPDATDGNTRGGIALVAEVMHELAENPKPPRELNDRLSAKLAAAEKLRKGWSRIPRMQGILAAAAEKPEEATKFYDEAVQRGDCSEPLVRELVRLYFRKERYADAQRVLAFVRQRGPLGAGLEQQYQVLVSVAGGDPTKALARALSKEMAESNSFQDHVLRAQVLARLGKEEEAKQALDAALKLSPAAPEVFVAKLRVLLVLGHSADKLRPEIEAAAKVLRAGNPTNPVAAPLALGQMWELVGDTDAAIKEYTAAMTAAPADRDAPTLLLAAYRRGNNTPAADSLLGKLAAGTDPDLRRWVKRMQAAALVAGPDAIANVPRALRLLDENIAEADRGEDRRARAFVLCADPLQRKAGLAELMAPRGHETLSSDDTFRLAGVLIEGAKFADAEKELSAVTTAGLLADPAHLVLLAQVQLLKNDLPAAGRTVSRLKAIAPNRPDVKLEDARLLAKSNLAKAAELVLTIPTTEPPPRKPLQLAQWMEGIGCVEQAEKLYDEYSRGPDPLPSRLTAVAEFYARTGRGDKALSLVKDADGKEGVTPELAARLMVAAVRGRPVASVPPAQKAEWEKAVEGVAKYVDEKAGATPSGAWALWQAELADGRGDQPKALTRYDAARDAFTRDTTANGKFGQGVALNNRVALRTLSAKEGTPDLLRQANEVIALVGPRAFALDTRGVVLFHSGRASAALPDFEAAVAYAASPANLFHLAQCYRKLGKTTEAADAIERAKLLGLTKASLHPLEATEYDALVK